MSEWGKTAAGTVAIVACAFVVGVVHNRISAEGIGLGQNPLQAVSNLEASWFLDTAQAKEKWDEGVTFVDARAEDFYRYQGHIRGAISLPVLEFDTRFPEVKDRLPSPEEEIVCYCSGFGCEESTELAHKLVEKGYRAVYVYEGGWPGWSEAGFPSEVEKVEEAGGTG
jgi:rhodanese-related sulfurtransferase